MGHRNLKMMSTVLWDLLLVQLHLRLPHIRGRGVVGGGKIIFTMLKRETGEQFVFNVDWGIR